MGVVLHRRMKKFLALLALATAPAAWGGAYDLSIDQYSPDGTERIPRLVQLPASGDGVLFYESSTMWPRLGTLSSCFALNSGVLNFSLACARISISLTTTGSGAATYNSGTGVLNVPTPAAPVTPTINDTPGRSLVTSTSATGYQISATRQSKGCYEGSVSTTSTIGGPAAATVFLETADTNSTTPGDWTVRARQTYSNTITLAVVLNQVQSNNWSLCRDIPAGKYVRLRVGSVSGTASATINSEQQEVTY